MRMPGTLVAIGVVERAAVVVARVGLGIERVEVRRPAPHPDLDHRLRRARRGLRARAEAVGEQQARRAEEPQLKRVAPGHCA